MIARIISAAAVCALLLGCTEEPQNDICENYPDWESSPYVLPFPVGNSFRISQGNCTNASHQQTLRYSYDIEMPFGSVITAARDGVVHAIRVTQKKGERGLAASNWILIRHSDGMISEYVHLAENGSFVEVGERVLRGDTIAITGDTGDVGTYPHVHFDISPCGNNLTCGTVPVTFGNTTSHANGLIEDVNYEALPY